MMRSMRAISPPLPYKFDTEVVPFLFFLKCRTAAAFAAAVLCCGALLWWAKGADNEVVP